MVQEGGAPGGCGGCLGDPGLTLYPPGGSFRSVPSPGDLMLTYGINYCLDSDDSHIYGSGLDLSPELPIRALSCFLTTFSGISQGRLQLQVASHPPPVLLPPLLLVLLLNEGHHPQPTAVAAPLAFTPEQFRSPSPATLARAPSSLTWMVSVASPHVSDPPGLSPHPQGLSDFTRGWSRQPLWGLIPCPLAWPGLSMPHDCWPREGTPLMLLGVRREKVLGSCPAQKCGNIRTPEG